VKTKPLAIAPDSAAAFPQNPKTVKSCSLKHAAASIYHPVPKTKPASTTLKIQAAAFSSTAPGSASPASLNNAVASTCLHAPWTKAASTTRPPQGAMSAPTALASAPHPSAVGAEVYNHARRAGTALTTPARRIARPRSIVPAIASCSMGMIAPGK
jgi:hypothetical protein